MSAKKWIPTEKEIEQIKTMAGLGLTIKEIALVLNVSSRTIDRRIEDNEEVAIAYKTGRAEAKIKVTEKLFEKIMSGHSASIFFYLKTQCGWRETDRTEDESPNQQVIFYLPEKD